MIKLQGTYTAMVTPFKDGKVNVSRLREMVDFQIENGVSGLVPCGTTGESPTLSHEEHRLVIDAVIEAAGGRVPVIAGTGSNSTKEAISLTIHAQDAGADCSLLITPYYNKPTQEGVIEHYKAIAGSCSIPLIVYNCPGRTAVNTTAETILTLAEVPTIIGVKEASGNMDQIGEILTDAPESFTVLSGDDSMTVPMMSIGAKGVISVTSNVAPRKMSEMTGAALDGNFTTASQHHNELFPLMRSLMKVQTNPSPIKSAMNIAGMEAGPVRLPLVDPDDAGKETLKRCMKSAGLL
ncbi:4-hydroxy-tetrahydrodipicolinate synthase [Candidatus Latescibacterota bacterium]